MRALIKRFFQSLQPDPELAERCRLLEIHDLQKKIFASERFVREAKTRIAHLRTEPALQKLREAGL